jgi:predicted permease
MRNFLQDLRYGLRTMAAKPGFTISAVIVLALGIGANTAIFSLVNAFLLKPLLIDKPEQLTGVFSRDSKKPDSYRAFSYPNYVDLRDKNTVFSSLLAHDLAMVGVKQGETTKRVFADIISSNYFSTLGVPLSKGRTFTAQEEQPGSRSAVVIVSYAFSKKQADPDLIGKTLRINGTLFTVVGIAPEGFAGTTAMVGGELYLPLGMFEQVINDFEAHGRPLAARDNHVLILVGRLRPGMTGSQADPQLAVVASQLASAYPGENKNQTFIARPLSRMSVSTQPENNNMLLVPAAILLSMAAVVLLIASLNIANMMLARGTARRREIAIRMAIGGQRRRIVQQLLTEGLLLAAVGGTVGIAIASWSTSLLVKSLSQLGPIDPVYSGAPDVRVLAATLGFCVLSTLLFALGPAWQLSRPELVTDLKESAGEEVAGGARRLFSRRNLLVMAQLSLSLMMLAAAGTFVRSAMRAANVEPGFALDHEILAEVDPSLAGYNETRGRQIYADLQTRLRRIPGVESVSLAATIPFGMIQRGREIQTDGHTLDAQYNVVTPDYFQTLNIPLLQGRAFQHSDTDHVVILDQTAATKLWPSASAVGRHIRLASEEAGKPADDEEVIGVVGNIQERLIGGGLQAHAYIPLGRQYEANMQVHLKVSPQANILPAVREEIRAVDERLPLLTLKTLRDHLDSSFDIWIVRTGATMLAIFGVVALLLAVIGLYGVKAYTVARRTREIGIRMALGASSGDALNMILREGMMVTLVGVGVGFVLALILGKLLSGFLYQVHAVEPLVLLSAPLVLTVVSLLACYFPARRAARVDPITALRYE